MPYKDPIKRREKQKEYSKKYYESNKDVSIGRSKASRASFRKVFKAYKATLSCTLCGEDHPAALDFHHHTPNPSNRKISSLLSAGQFARAMSEIEEKCIVLCANCHRKHHYEEQQKGKV